MPSIQVKDVPEETHAVLRRRAAEAHQSLQEYLRTKLIADAAEPTMAEVLDRINHRSGGSRVTTADTLEAIHEGRRERGEHLDRLTSRRDGADAGARP